MNQPASLSAAAPIPTRAWLPPLGLLVLTWLALGLLLDPTFVSMVRIWDRSETYAHGFVVVPIAFWLAWRNRHQLAATPLAPDWRALAPAALLGALWVAARVSGVLVVEQYAFTGLLIVAVWAVLGLRMLAAAAFPLGFLLLMVPNGEFLIPPLIEFTADFTVGALRLLGMPVYREGPFFSIPSGEWNVVEGCSGLRYLIASITLGVLYAYLTYRTLWKRVAFGLAAVVVPVLANGARATMIVLIAHYSDMKLALGVDHFIYGWVWFGIVMLAMFWVGLIWREDLAEEVLPEPMPAAALRPNYRIVLALLALVAVFPLYRTHLEGRPLAQPELALPAPAAGWQSAPAGFTAWLPHWIGMDAQRVAHYAKGDQRVLLFTAWYASQRQDAELINTQNYMVPQKDAPWQNTGETVREVAIGGQTLTLRQATLRSVDGREHFLAWQWHRIDGRDGLDPYRAKLRLAWLKLSGQSDAGAGIVLAAPYGADPAQAEAQLRDFLAALKPGLDAMLDGANR